MPTQTVNTVLEQVMELVSKQADISEEQISLDSNFQDDLGFDSLEQVEFIMAVEERFDIEVPDETASEIRTVRQAVDEIEQAIASKKG
ncbi:acyl carrier protein [Verrucomicrobiota bacterium]